MGDGWGDEWDMDKKTKTKKTTNVAASGLMMLISLAAAARPVVTLLFICDFFL